MNELKKLTPEDLENTLEVLTKRFYDIPFENSDFQNKSFVIQAQQTPARAYRAIGLKMFAKLNAIKELKYGRMLDEVDADEYRQTIATDGDEFKVRRATIKLEKLLAGRGYTDKLLNDTIHELNFLHKELQRYPEYDREMFEEEEQQHFSLSLNLQADLKNSGAHISLNNMNSPCFESNLAVATQHWKSLE